MSSLHSRLCRLHKGSTPCEAGCAYPSTRGSDRATADRSYESGDADCDRYDAQDVDYVVAEVPRITGTTFDAQRTTRSEAK